MAGEIIAHNDCLKERSEKTRVDFQSATTLRLFSNDFHPAVTDTIGAFAESSYPGYARKNMVDQWRDVFKVEDGKWMFQSKDIAFVSTGASNENAHGWYLVRNGKVQLSCRLPFPVLMTIGNAVTVRVDCITWAAILLGEEL